MVTAGRGNITTSLVEEIGGAIVRGDYAAGEALPAEPELTESLGVSRTALREAVKMLASKGLLQSWPRRGTLVQPEERWNLLDPDILRWLLERQVSKSIVIDFLHMRLAIESAAAAMAASKKANTSGIELALERMRNPRSSIDGALLADIEFHSAILRASGNRFFVQITPLVDSALRMTIPITNKIKGHTADIEEHEKILLAIRKGNARQAKNFTASLIEGAIALVETMD